MGFYTGLRLKDISEMEWQSIEVDQAIIRVRTKKTAQKLAIPIAPALLEWISAQPQGIGRAKVFPQLAGKSGTGRSGLSMQFRRIMEKAGIRGRILREGSKGGAGRAQSSLSFHSLRHTFNSALANACVSQELRQKLTGHKSVSMNDRYTHLQIDALRSEVAKLPHVKRS
jgi:integrase